MAELEHGFFVARDGKRVSEFFADENDTFKWILDHQGQSYDWALRHEGYSTHYKDADGTITKREDRDTIERPWAR